MASESPVDMEELAAAQRNDLELQRLRSSPTSLSFAECPLPLSSQFITCIRSALKADLGSFSAELVYGVPLRLPGGFFSSSSPPLIHDASTYIRDLRNTFRHITPVIPAARHPQSVFIGQDLASYADAFIRLDDIRPPITPAYDGLFRVLHRAQKTFTLDVNGREDVAKSAYIDTPLPVVPTLALASTAPPLYGTT
ncbi:uncharacterized protein LOC144102581 [Amblyomma americanum]